VQRPPPTPPSSGMSKDQRRNAKAMAKLDKQVEAEKPRVYRPLGEEDRLEAARSANWPAMTRICCSSLCGTFWSAQFVSACKLVCTCPIPPPAVCTPLCCKHSILRLLLLVQLTSVKQVVGKACSGSAGTCTWGKQHPNICMQPAGSAQVFTPLPLAPVCWRYHTCRSGGSYHQMSCKKGRPSVSSSQSVSDVLAVAD